MLRGAWLGFCIAAPVGPIGILVLKQSVQRGRWAGIASGFGAALADLIYGYLTIAGVRLAGRYGRVTATAGGLLLLWLAWKSWRETPRCDDAAPELRAGWRNTFTTFLLTLSNPMTILMFAGLIASAATNAPAQFVAGVFLGSMAWWIILSTTAAWLGQAIAIRGSVLNRIAAVTLASFGVWALWAQGLAAGK